MLIVSEIPHTEQGLLDYIRYAENEIEYREKKNKQLKEMIAECGNRLTQLGYYLQDGKWRK